jgi:hypothetical protein
VEPNAVAFDLELDPGMAMRLAVQRAAAAAMTAV